MAITDKDKVELSKGYGLNSFRILEVLDNTRPSA